MKCSRLAELLLMTPDAEVEAWDADMQAWYPVTGLVGDYKTQQICTDDPT